METDQSQRQTAISQSDSLGCDEQKTVAGSKDVGRFWTVSNNASSSLSIVLSYRRPILILCFLLQVSTPIALLGSLQAAAALYYLVQQDVRVIYRGYFCNTYPPFLIFQAESLNFNPSSPPCSHVEERNHGSYAWRACVRSSRWHTAGVPF